jgi:mRNA interferase MazF
VGTSSSRVMTRDQAIGALNEVLVVLATTTIRDLPTEVRLGPEDGMPRGCVLNLDHVDTVDKGFIGDRITTLSAEKLHSVGRALDVATGCGWPPMPSGT